MATPQKQEFQNVYIRAHNYFNQSSRLLALARDILSRASQESGPDWERRVAQLERTVQGLSLAVRGMEMARTQMKDAWSQSEPFPTPV